MSFHTPQPPQQRQAPPQSRTESFNVAPGGAVESFQPHGFSGISGVWVDNFSGGWLSIENHNLWIPPYTRGWKANILPSMASITIRSYDFANGTRIAGANGTAAIVTLWDMPNGDSEGIEFFDAQTIPIVNVRTLTAVAGVFNSPVIAAPAVGRIRVYEVRMVYAGFPPVGFSNPGGITNSQAVWADVYVVGASVATLEISPAHPSDFQIITPPGGDLPIGAALFIIIYTDDVADNTTTIRLVTRYAIR